MEKYYIDSEGNFLGVWVGGDKPEGGIEVDELPPHGWQKRDLDNNKWKDLTTEDKEKLKK